MLAMSVVTNAAQVAAEVEGFADQIPFATALALTRTAQDVQAALKARLGDHFTVRSNWVTNSIRYRPAKKGVNPVAYVGSVYEPMADQVEGGTKEGRGGRDVAVPVWARRDKGATTKPGQWPGKLAKRKNFFVAPFSTGPFGVGRAARSEEGVGLFQRIGRGKGKKHLRLWWTIRDSVQIKARWPFGEESNAAVRAEFADNFWAALEQARATAKPTKRSGAGIIASRDANIAAGMAWAFANGAGR